MHKWWTNKDLNLEPIGYEPIALTVVLLVHMCAAQPAHEGRFFLEFPIVTPRVVGPGTKPSIDFPLKVMNIYKMNLLVYCYGV